VPHGVGNIVVKSRTPLGDKCSCDYRSVKRAFEGMVVAPGRRHFITYYRVSTSRQGMSGLGIEAQRAAARQFLAVHPGIELASFTEVESGKNADRPQLQRAMTRCRQTRATLLVAKLDRLSADRNFKRPSGPRLPTTLLRVTGLMLPPSLGAAWLACAIWATSRLRRRAFGRCRATKPASRTARMAPTPAFTAA
jgi:hypothetical protein